MSRRSHPSGRSAFSGFIRWAFLSLPVAFVIWLGLSILDGFSNWTTVLTYAVVPCAAGAIGAWRTASGVADD
ncbi:MAG: hypothetical protein ABGX91_04095 [Thermoleophilia bacterium]|jgi:hypothetical protein